MRSSIRKKEIEIDPVRLEIVRNSFVSLCEEMGASLRRTAYSPNIKERMDASCAAFGPMGKLIAQAEHIPVHLGAMDVGLVEAVRNLGKQLGPGDQVVCNDPYMGGTHLPDISIYAPLIVEDRVIGYVANRAHHADIGGRFPGSMPAGSETLEEEGLVIRPTLIMEANKETELLERIAEASNTPWERKGDLRAQIAANRLGCKRLLEINERFGSVRKIAAEIEEYSHRRMKAGLVGFNKVSRHSQKGAKVHSATADKVVEKVVETDQGRIKFWVKVLVNEQSIYFNLSRSSDEHHGNLNAPRPVVLATAYYVVRSLLDPDITPNSGMYRSIAVKTRKGSVLDPIPGAAVAAGNVETSQMLVDLMLDALKDIYPDRVPAMSQGTMNNITFSGKWPDTGEVFTYYETLGGGEGALPYRDGMSGVHTHMTNTMNTPIEALERRYPLRLIEYRLREGSGGKGKFNGGDGLVRTYEFLGVDGHLSIMSGNRKKGPKGLNGGEPGFPGENCLIRDGEEAVLPGFIYLDLLRGDIIRISTPGGGGWGKPSR